MRKKQAAPDLRMADEMGVSSYIPKNIKIEERVTCEWMDSLKLRDDQRIVPCDRSATHQVTVDKDGVVETENVCERHAKDAQVEYVGTVTVRRRKLA